MRYYTCKATAVFLCTLVALAAIPRKATAAELVTITSGIVVVSQTLQPPTTTPPAFASVLLLAGGDGVLALDPQGNVRQLQGNFLIRSAYRFLNIGLNVAMLDAPGSLNGVRLTEAHARYVASAIAAVRTHWPNKKVWLVGTSNGTISAFNVAARTAVNAVPPSPPFADKPDGIVLASPIVQSGTAGETVLGTTPSFKTAKLNIPVLVVSHKLDPCSASDATLAGSFSAALNSTASKFYLATGAMPAAAQLPCDAFSFHGFHGIEDVVVKDLGAFIKSVP
jgi:pimeloyl-ACP methyl ester carboxylesterase